MTDRTKAKPKIVKIGGLAAKAGKGQDRWARNEYNKKINRTVEKAFDLLIAKWLRRLIRDCPVFGDVVAKPFIEEIKAVVPNWGFKLDLMEAVSHEYATGLSLSNIFAGPSKIPLKERQALLNRVNGTQVTIAAVFDLLTMQGDRHDENVYIKPNGNIQLIDNLDHAFVYPNSIFLPQTFLHERLYVSNGGMRNPRTKRKASFANGKYSRREWPKLRFDMRCYEDPSRPKRLPRGVFPCLDRIAKKGWQWVADSYGMPEMIAKMFTERAKIITQQGVRKALGLILRNKPHSPKTVDGAVVHEYSTGRKPYLLQHETFPPRPTCCDVVNMDSREDVQCHPELFMWEWKNL
eukprot:CAMPEP_0197862918 /NCGR_PEP_ID=MMETSP1438-20131217/40026_1 /TAXON_ID=1461541 /ORGANISM="Pterosperma sp., Strain CCMP1384" /LENGTH=348 /DNA_ID=CAMNT_0043480639 /DNA_START=175 /DNA_END=1221 /DNA_ORIENTATION=-